MALLSGMMRTYAITGSTDSVYARIAGRQGGQWADHMVRAAMPRAGSQVRATPSAAPTRPPADPVQTLRQLTELRARGIVTDAEFERLRAGLGV